MLIYIDLNIFDRLEKIHKLEEPEKSYYQTLLDLLKNEQVNTAYSNAHLNDLFRGYQKNPTYIQGHLDNIQCLTKNLCICQYWGDKAVQWHYRNIFDFFQKKVDEWEFELTAYDDLFEDDPLMKKALDLYKLIPLPKAFKNGYKDPMFGVIFPLSKVHNNMYSLQSDIFNIQSRLRSDYGFYKSLRTYILNNLNKFRSNKEFINSLNANFKELPKHLELTDIFDAYTPSNKTNGNIFYSKIIETFFKYDLSGYKSDGHFNNMFDDALHTFYAAHFDYFITNDVRCNYKASKVFDRLNIETKVLNITEIGIIKT